MVVFFFFQGDIYSATVCQWERLSHLQKCSSPVLISSFRRCIRLPRSSFMFLRVMNFSFSRMAIVWVPGNMTLVASQSQFLQKNINLPEHIEHKCDFCIRHINALYMWFWDSVKRGKTDSPCEEWIIFSSFPAWFVVTRNAETTDYLSGGCVKARA